MIRHRLARTICSAALVAAIAAAAFAAAAPALAQNPCKSEDPLDFDEANRRADCGGADQPGWGTYDYDNQSARLPDHGSTGATASSTPDYSALPTTFSAWYYGLSAADKAKFAARLTEEAGVGDRRLSQQEIDALLRLVTGELDSYFDSEGLTADQRRRAIAEIAVESGVGLGRDGKRELSPDDAIFGSDRRRFGDADYDDYGGYADQGWERVDPTSGFGEPDDGAADSDPDFLDGF
jgi:hypothetical protein